MVAISARGGMKHLLTVTSGLQCYNESRAPTQSAIDYICQYIIASRRKSETEVSHRLIETFQTHLALKCWTHSLSSIREVKGGKGVSVNDYLLVKCRISMNTANAKCQFMQM